MKNQIIIFVFLILSNLFVFSQVPTYEYTLSNDRQVSPNVYEFDIYLKRTGGNVLEVANTQIGLNFNGLIRNGGILTFSLVPGTSEFVSSQIPTTFSVDTINNILRIAPRANPGAGNGTIISNTGNGTRFGRFRITNSVPFNLVSLNLSWNFISTPPLYPTRLSAYVNGVATEVTVPSSHLINLNNPILNALISGTKFNDKNRNGIKDGDENGLQNWKIRLSKSNVQVDSVLTDLDGNYVFTNLSAGTYIVSEETIPGWVQTTSPTTYSIEITNGIVSTGNNFGNFKLPELNIKVLMEGFYNQSTNLMIPDTILIELRKTYLPYALEDSGRVRIDSLGQGNLFFNNAKNDTPYYLVVKHRNSIETWSATGQTFNLSNLNYDFTTSASKAYGNNMILKGSKWCIYSGDCTQDGWVDGLDMNGVDNDAANFVHGYYPTDVNGDNWIDGKDMNIVDNNSGKFIYSIKPYYGSKNRAIDNLIQQNQSNQSNMMVSYEYYLMNDVQTAPNVYEFDIYLKRTGENVLEVANTQMGLFFNGLIRNGGILTFSLVPGTSEFLTSQIPASFSVDTVNNILRVAPRANPGAGNGTIISNTGNGTRYGRFRITNSVPFGIETPNISWNFDHTNGKYPTVLSAYVNGYAMEITQPTSHFNFLVNPLLPIQLLSFDGFYIKELNGVKLEWTTISEINNYGFYVERKHENDEDYTEIPNSFIPGGGSTLESRTYSFIDNTIILPGSYYYRIRQVDNNGLIYYSNPIVVNVTTLTVREEAPIQFRLYQNYPNPFNPSTTIKFSVDIEGPVLVVLYDVLGQKVATLFDDIAKPGYYYKINFDASNLSNGVYYYRIITNNNTDLKKMTLIK